MKSIICNHNQPDSNSSIFLTADNSAGNQVNAKFYKLFLLLCISFLGIQAGAQYYITLTPSSLSFPAEGGTKTFTIDTNTPSQTITYDSWITSVTRSGNTVTVTCGPNCSTYGRGGAVVVSSQYAGAGCSISQAAGGPATANAGPPVASINSGGTTAPLGGSVGGSATTGIWSSSAGGTFSPSATNLNATWTSSGGYSGTATLTLTTTNGCGTASASKSATVMAEDYITLTPSSLSFPYTGGTKTFTISTNTSSQSLSYPSWMTVTRSGNTVTVTCGLYCGSYSRGGAVVVSSQYAGAGCSVTQAAGVSATANAGPSVSPICSGGTTAQLGGSVGGSSTTGIWSSSAGGTFSPYSYDLNARWTPPSGYSGTATLTLTTTNGCGTAYASKNVSVSPSASISSPTGDDNQSVPAYSPISSISYTTYYTSNVTVTNLPSGVTHSYIGNTLTISGTPTVEGSFTYTITASNTCSQKTKTGQITVTPAPTEIIPPSELQVNQSTLTIKNGQLTANGKWKWYSNYNTALPDEGSSITAPSATRSTRYRVRGEDSQNNNFTYFLSTKVQKTETTNLPQSKNYIITYSPVQPKTTADDILTLPLEEQGIVVQYFDGLGRPDQTVAVNQSWYFNDLVTGVGYDSYGRQDKAYLPATNYGKGSFVEEQADLITGFYNTAHNEIDGLPTLQDGRIATITHYEKSPLNRVESIVDPAGGTTTFLYGTNNGTEVPKWKIVNTNDCYRNPNDRFYAASELYMTQTTDPDGKTVKEYKDKLGQVVMKDAGGTKTCYVYDDFGLLRYVLSPEATNKMASGTYTPENDTIKGLCYYYEYDGRKRMIKKQLPGAEPVLMIYDARDRLVLVQDGKTRASDPNQWLYTRYEQLNRPVKTGWLTSTSSWDALQTAFKNTINIDSMGFAWGDELTETKYDLYPNNGLCTLPTKNTSVKGLVTYTKSKILDGSGYYHTNYFYDDKYRVIQTNTTGGPIGEIIKNTYDFVGNLISSTEIYSGQWQVKDSITRWFTYDHAGRLEKVKQEIGGDSQNGKVVLAQHDYNELGQLMLKKLHMANNTSYRQDIDYAYDIRGWLKAINNLNNQSFRKLYAQELDYDANGNISRITWKNTTLNINGSVENGIERTYAFGYDELNRLNQALYSQIENISGIPTPSGGQFNVIFPPMPYDDNGNIKKLIRNGNRAAAGEPFNFGMIDDLTYNYEPNSNRLSSVTDAVTTGVNHDLHYKNGTGTYTYDWNGNATFIPDKNVSINYNYLNLPDNIGTIFYLYSASGNKLKKTFGTSETYYQGSVLKINGNPVVLNPDGRAVWSSSTSKWEYEYDVKDHLGNTRASFAPTTDKVKVLQTRDYYPFGLEMANWYLNDANATKFRYNGKELQDEDGLGWYDYGARFYDPSLGRFHTQDRFAEKYLDFSPYQYAVNNPILFIDVNGDSVNIANLYAMENGKYLNPNQIKSFEVWASTRAGSQYILDHAQKGFKLHGIFQTDLKIQAINDGKSHSKGIDVSFGVVKKIESSGNTNRKIGEDDRLKLSFDLNAYVPDTKQDLFSAVETWSHEVFIHGDHHEKKFLNQTPYSDVQNNQHILPFESTKYYNVGIETLQQAQRILNFNQVNTRNYIYRNVMLPNYNYNIKLREDIKN